MLNSRNIKEFLMNLLSSGEGKYAIGSRLNGEVLAFDQTLLDERRQELATILKEIGLDKQQTFSLARLTFSKDGEMWNRLQTGEDFEALELLLACSDACGFVHNSATTVSQNMSEIGELNAVLVSNSGRAMVNDDIRWAKLIRERIASKVNFLTEPEIIAEYADNYQTVVAGQR